MKAPENNICTICGNDFVGHAGNRCIECDTDYRAFRSVIPAGEWRDELDLHLVTTVYHDCDCPDCGEHTATTRISHHVTLKPLVSPSFKVTTLQCFSCDFYEALVD